MAYRFRRSENVLHGLQHIVREQVDKAIEDITESKTDKHIVVHDVRKRCKKIRAAVRLVRPQFEETYQEENAWYRDLGRSLSDLRDAEAMLETVEELRERFEAQINPISIKAVRDALTAERDRLAQTELDLDKHLNDAVEAFRKGRERIDTWQISDTDFEGIRGGFVKTFRRGRKAMEQAYKDPTPENFHEWRKRVKYHWYHACMLDKVWKRVMKAYTKELKVLSDYLGDEHDLNVFIAKAPNLKLDDGHEDDVAAVLALAERRREELRRHAQPLGARVYSESPKALGKRLEGYWDAWRTDF